MKKTLVALAALAAVGAASAQSTVSITGVIGAAYQSADANTSAYRGLTLTNADFKLSAMEDLGGGLRALASVAFETPTSAGSAANIAANRVGNFDSPVVRRDTSLALAGSFGVVGFSNTRSSNMLTRGMVAPANLQENIFDVSGIINRGAVDVVQFETTSMNGLKGFVQYVESGVDGNGNPISANTSAIALIGATPAQITAGIGAGLFPVGTSTSAGSLNAAAFGSSTLVLGATYAQGPLAVGAQYKMYTFSGLFKDALAAKGLSIHRSNRLEAFATYDLGAAKVGFGYDGANVGTYGTNTAVTRTSGSATDGTENDVNSSAAYSLGVAAPIGAITVGANWAKRADNNLYELVAKYELSKRTNVNASFGRQSFDADAGASTSGITGHQYRLGLYHNF